MGGQSTLTLIVYSQKDEHDLMWVTKVIRNSKEPAEVKNMRLFA